MSDFTQVFFDDFNGSSLNRDHWNALYSGQYGNGMFQWDAGQLEVGDGKLTIATEREGGSWVSGGLSTIPEGQTYGSYEFRARFDEGQGTATAILLWPSNNQWTDEVDIIETHRADREGFAFTNHGSPNVTEYIDQDISGWHTYRLDWTPGELKLFIDGNQRAEINTDVPSQEMSFGMQGHVLADWETWFGGGPDGSTPNRVEAEIDWVRVSEWTPGSGGGNTKPNAPAEETPVVEAPSEEPSWEQPVAEAPAQPAADPNDPWAAFTVNGQVDWAAASAAVLANFEETGQWFL
jgi:beta-glucanase (GH16 family)